MTTVARNQDRNKLLLTYAGFDGIEFDLFHGDELRPARHVRVPVGSGTSWAKAVRFPSMGSEATASTGDEALDREILERAAEELVRLDAATVALRAAA